jgi:hypothetical protein
MGAVCSIRVSAARSLLTLTACCCLLATAARAQQPQPPEDPEDNKKVGLWLDQGLSAGLWTDKSLEVEFYERFDEGASNLYEYFVQAGIAFRPRPWLMVLPLYRYQRFPGMATAYENRILLNLTVSRPQGSWRPNLRTLIEGRFPDDRAASARIRLRPGIDYVLPLRTSRPLVLVVNNEFFLVPWTNPFANGGAYTQNRFQAGVRLPITASLTLRPYFMVQSVNLPSGWDSNNIIGISLTYKLTRTTKTK